MNGNSRCQIKVDFIFSLHQWKTIYFGFAIKISLYFIVWLSSRVCWLNTFKVVHQYFQFIWTNEKWLFRKKSKNFFFSSCFSQTQKYYRASLHSRQCHSQDIYIGTYNNNSIIRWIFCSLKWRHRTIYTHSHTHSTKKKQTIYALETNITRRLCVRDGRNKKSKYWKNLHHKLR